MKFSLLLGQAIFLTFVGVIQAADTAFLSSVKPDPKKDISLGSSPEALIELGKNSWRGPLRMPGNGFTLVKPPSGSMLQIFKMTDGKVGVRSDSGKIEALDPKNAFDKEVLRDLGRFIISRGLYREGDGKAFLKAYFDLDLSPTKNETPKIGLSSNHGLGPVNVRPVLTGDNSASLLSLLTEPDEWEAKACTKKECTYESKNPLSPNVVKMGGLAKILVEAPEKKQAVVAASSKKSHIEKADTSAGHQDFLKKAKEAKKTVVILAGNIERCPPCKALHESIENGNLSEDEGLAVLYLDVDRVFDHGYNLGGGIPKIIIRHPETGNIVEQMPGGGITASAMREKLKALGLSK